LMRWLVEEETICQPDVRKGVWIIAINGQKRTPPYDE